MRSANRKHTVPPGSHRGNASERAGPIGEAERSDPSDCHPVASAGVRLIRALNLNPQAKEKEEANPAVGAVCAALRRRGGLEPLPAPRPRGTKQRLL